MVVLLDQSKERVSYFSLTFQGRFISLFELTPPSFLLLARNLSIHRHRFPSLDLDPNRHLAPLQEDPTPSEFPTYSDPSTITTSTLDLTDLDATRNETRSSLILSFSLFLPCRSRLISLSFISFFSEQSQGHHVLVSVSSQGSPVSLSATRLPRIFFDVVYHPSTASLPRCILIDVMIIFTYFCLLRRVWRGGRE